MKTKQLKQMETVTIQIPALPRPTLEVVQGKLSWVKSIEPGSDTSTEEAVTLKLYTVLQGEETSIDGDEYERRLIAQTGKLGFQQALWLEEHQAESPELMALLGKVYIDFTGIVLVDGDGYRGFPYLGDGGERFKLNRHWIEYGFSSLGRVAGAGEPSTLGSSAQSSDPLSLSGAEIQIKVHGKTYKAILS